MLHCQSSVQQTHYHILSVKEDASYEEIRTSYRLPILNYHPDMLQNTDQIELEDIFLKVQKAWEIPVRALRKDTGAAENVSLEDMMIEDGGEILELFYQCRCGDYYSVDSLELEKMGYTLLRDENKISFETGDASPASVALPCGTCSLQVRLSIDTDIKVPINVNS